MKLLAIVVLSGFIPFICCQTYDLTKCRTSRAGREYIGAVSTTSSGRTCEPWTLATWIEDWRFPERSKKAALNYCRNPSNDGGGPWCNVKDPLTGYLKQEFCGIPHCYGILDRVEPRQVGRNGEARITLYGAGFARNQFNFGADSNLGNKVWLVSDYESVDCEVFPEQSTEAMIQCFTPALDLDMQYRVRLSVDGVATPLSAICNGDYNSWWCSIQAVWWVSPRIYSIFPTSGAPDTIITMYGTFYTDRYGSNSALATNGKTQSILRVYVGGQNCELKDGDTFYGMYLESEYSDNGYIRCKIKSSFVANSNVSVIIEPPYGRTYPMPQTYSIAASQSLYMFQSYAVIDSVSPASGSVEGGQLLTITGRFFDQTTSPAQVTIGGAECKVESVTDGEILCRTPARPDMQGHNASYPGNRGVNNDFFNTSFVYFAQLDRLQNRTDQVMTFWTDGAGWCEDYSPNPSGCFFRTVTDNFNIRSRGFFVPPADGDYRLLLKCDDQSILYFSFEGPEWNKTRIAECPGYSSNLYNRYPTQTSQRMTLKGGKSYYFEVLFTEMGSTSHSYVGAAFYQSNLADSIEGRINPERQSVVLRSQSDPESFIMNLESLATQTRTQEVQKVDVKFSSPEGTFRLGLYGAFTDVLDSNTNALALEKALNDLASLHPEKVSVTAADITGGTSFTVTFLSDQGNWPSFESIGNSSTIQVTQITAGVPSLSKWRLQLNRDSSVFLSNLITTTTPTPDQMKDAVQSLFTARCPPSISAPIQGRVFFESYEVGTSPGFFTGQWDRINEPFCGQASAKNPYLIYNNGAANLDIFKHVCFAYRGIFREFIRIYFKSGSIGNQNIYPAYKFINDKEWHYTCINLYSLVSTTFPSASGFTLMQLELYRESYNDVWVDEVYIGGIPPTAFVEHVKERRIALPVRLQSLSVANTGSSSEYNVTFRPYDCAADFELVRVLNAPQSAGSPASNSASYGGGSWPAGSSVAVNRNVSAASAVSGTFNLTYKGKTISDIPAAIDVFNLKNLVSFYFGLDEVRITRTGDCYGYTYNFEWTKSSGDQSPLTVDGNSSLRGNNAGISVVASDGHIFFDPLPGDMVRTRETSPQVQVKINGIASRCSGNCSYSWSPNLTPSVTSVSPTAGQYQNSLTITGTKFSANASTIEVLIGGEPCSITTASTTQIRCNLGNSPFGSHKVVVNIDGIGLASSESTFTVNQFSVSGFLPSSGTVGGGTEVVINGKGFTPDAIVVIGDKNCTISSIKTSQIVCVSQRGTAGAANLSVTIAGTTVKASSSFTYTAAAAPTVSSVSSNKASVKGGEVLVLQGSNFGAFEDLSVSLSSAENQITLSLNQTATTGTHIEALLPSLSPGAYTIRVFVKDVGYASFSANEMLEVVLRMDELSTKQGSLEGGTDIVILGEGFGTVSDDVKVLLGETECKVTGVTDSQISCTSGRGSKTHLITNSGFNPDYGTGYWWHPASAVIKSGDRIRFQWMSPPFVLSNNFKVVQTPNASSDPGGNGFDSGVPSPNGFFVHQFNEPGTYYFTSGKVDTQKKVEMRGMVVVEERTSLLRNVTVQVAGQLATAGGGSSWSDSQACPGTAVKIPGCSSPSPLTGGDFEFAFEICFTPQVNSQNTKIGYINTVIELTGAGFSSVACQNEILVGEYPCKVSSQSSTQLRCSLNSTDEPDVGIAFPVEVTINNRGKALNLAVNKTFTLIPVVNSVSPASGSLNGGQSLTITGSGFTGSVSTAQATIGANGAACAIQQISYSEIVCITDRSSAVSESVVVIVTNQLNAKVTADCRDSCLYNYTATSTPSITSLIGNNAISGASTDLVIAGTGFGDNQLQVTVTVGSTPCNVTSVTDTQINCTVGRIRVGSHAIKVNVIGKGNSNDYSITSNPSVSSITPSSGSIWGGQLVTIAGSGFLDGAISSSVTIKNVPCTVISSAVDKIVCLTKAATAENGAIVSSRSGSISFPVLRYNYSVDATPTVTAVSPSSGVDGDVITITGTGFSSTADDNTVTIGGSTCTVTASSVTQIKCTLSTNAPGTYNLTVNVNSKGNSEGRTAFQYLLSVTSVSPSSGSYGGGLEITVGGTGFTDKASVLVCGKPCSLGPVTSSQIRCSIPSLESQFSASTICNVTVIIGGTQVIRQNAFTYASSKTPEISSVTPKRGGTMGGTKVTISGSKFGARGQNRVTVGGVECNITSESTTQIVCTTDQSGRSLKTNVAVTVNSNGLSLLNNSDYWYIDVWSSNFTWGGAAPPEEGDFVTVPKGQLLLLDISTPVLKMLLIRGGELLFDEADITLRAENILVVEGGKFTVGSEDAPFQHQATIELHGQLRAQELPIFGAKCLGVREGEINLHGKPIRMTWTRLAATAAAGATQIQLEWGQADWPVGGQIVIATTGDMFSQGQSETHTIKSISSDGTTITLTDPLKFTHLGETKTLSPGYTIEMRAEVALLTRNVRVIGTNDPQWNDEIKACPEGFDPGEFATQTCFQGRFGDEIGTDQFGAHIMLSAPVMDKKLVVGKFSFIELNYVGQAFRLGRYPIHFHMNGDMLGSYVRGVAIHKAFNRAVNIHGTHNVTIEHTVIFNIMGGAFFLEDGIETQNKYLYNLALFVKASSSLLNDDITPAAFWATNPANDYLHNAAAGGTHFGWWYRMKENPEGPSFTSSYCPRKVPLGKFFNNTVHSNGWFGVWTFQDYFPSVGGTCASTVPEPARFEKLTVWNSEKGAEFVNAGSVQFHQCLFVNNARTGLEGKRNLQLGASAPYTDRGPMINDSVIAAYVPGLAPSGSRLGITLPWSEGFSVRGVTFINYDSPENAAVGMTAIQGTCSILCGGYNYHFSGIKFINGDKNIGIFRWLYDGVFIDLDGTLTGSNAQSKVLATTGTLNPAKCVSDARFSLGVPASICDSTTSFVRLAFNNPNYESMKFKHVIMVNEFGNQSVPYAAKRLTHKPGWMAVVELGQRYSMFWENLPHFTNLSYTAAMSDLSGGGVVIAHKLLSKPDRVGVAGVEKSLDSVSPNALTYENNVNGDFYFDENKLELSYLISDITSQSRKKRAIGDSFVAQNYQLKAYKCFWPDCQAPPDQNSLPPLAKRPDDWVYWSNTTIWPNGILPTEDSDVIIEKGIWVVADIEFPRLRSLTLKGNLEFENVNPTTNENRNFRLEVGYIIILGGRLVIGWEDNRFMGNVEIILTGDENSEPWPKKAGVDIGQKVIASFGGLDIHGRQRSPVHTTLSATVNPGDNKITVSQAVDWQVGEDIVIASTTYDTFQAEVFRIAGISGQAITLNATVANKHLGETLTTDSEKTYSLSAEVGLLTRNVVIRGAGHANMIELGFGGRVLVGKTLSDDNTALIGWARISFAQFINMGQLGFNMPFDPRYAVSYVETGPVSTIKPSYVRGNSFVYGFSAQIAAFGADGLRIQNNILHGFVAAGVVLTGDNHLLDMNLAINNIWSGSYNGRNETKNSLHEATFELVDSGTNTVTNNIAAGYERAGFRIHGEPCDGDIKFQQTPAWSGNKAHSGLTGVVMFDMDPKYPTCSKIQGFFAWKNSAFGIYANSPTPIQFTDNVAIENAVGVISLVVGPSVLSHTRHTKTVILQKSFISGPTNYYDCEESMPLTFSSLLTTANFWTVNGTAGVRGQVGVSFATFMSGSNKAPLKPQANSMTYPSIDGRLELTDVTFANFKTRTCATGSFGDYVISDNPRGGDDIQHPVYLKGITVESTVEKDRFVFMARSNLGKVNPSDCVDMDCDGLKKGLIVDTDGSLLGSAGSIVDDAAYQWDGDASYGLGDYRIPKSMLMFPNNTRFSAPPNKGIHRSKDCVYRQSWQAYECHEFKYVMVVIESMDADTEVRRLSPIAVWNKEDGYVDLLNGPQDHGWCAGYTCQKRVSTFWALAAAGQTYHIYLSSTNPQQTRFFLINADENTRVRLAVYYSSPQRLDVFADSIFVYPTNADLSASGYSLKAATQDPPEWLPSVETGVLGANYFDRLWKEQYIILRGIKPVDIVIKEVVVVSLELDPMTIDDFFGTKIVENLAKFLNVPAAKIRIVNVVRESSRKRSTSGTKIDIEIGDPPKAGNNITQVNSGELSRDALLNVTRKIVDAAQLGTFDAELNITTLSMDIQEPLPPPENSTSSSWAKEAQQGSQLSTIQIPSRMVFEIKPVADREQQPFTTQPAFAMYDNKGELVKILGSKAQPWKLGARLRTNVNPNAYVVGETTCGFVDGWCNFTTLGISHEGAGYIIDFVMVDPPSANFKDSSSALSVREAELTAGFPIIPNKDIPVNVSAPFTVKVSIQDRSSGLAVKDVEWKGLTWQAKISIYLPDMSPSAVLSGTLTKPFDRVTGLATFDDLSINVRGRYSLAVEVTSSSNQKLTSRSPVLEIISGAIMQLEEYSYQVQLKFNSDYQAYAAGNEDVVEASLYNYLQKNDDTIRYHDFSISQGSIIINFWASGTQKGVKAVIDSIASSLTDSSVPLTLPAGSLTLDKYMLVDASVYKDLKGTSIASTASPTLVPSEKPENTSGAIVGGVIGGLAVIALIVVLAVVLVQKKKKAKTVPEDEESRAKTYQSLTKTD